jgi:hypothetical protein
MLPTQSQLVWVLSTRPSGDGFPNSGGTTTRLYNVLRSAGLLDRVHVTDYVKFRGPGPDSRADHGVDETIVIDGIQRTLRDVSLRCLEAEWTMAPPAIVLVAGRKAQSWINRQLDGTIASRSAAFVEPLRAAMIPVTSWMAYVPGIAAQWRSKLG